MYGRQKSTEMEKGELVNNAETAQRISLVRDPKEGRAETTEGKESKDEEKKEIHIVILNLFVK